MTQNELAVYIHWPYCLSKCPYCDFNSHVADKVDHKQWRDAYTAELAYTAALVPDRIVRSIYFGGGTPSLMEPETVGHVIERIRTYWRLSNDVEITLEANPTSVEQERFKAYQHAGVNRISLGIQSLRPAALTFLGRRHSVPDALYALETARSLFDRVSFDLIYARPGQTEEDWAAELREALSYADAGHLSLYQLTIEPGTAFETMYKRRDFHMPDDELGGRLYELTADIVASHGFQAYEISNYARPDQQSRHNLAYWRYGDYAGIGPGAHGRLTMQGTKQATRTHRAPQIWLDKVTKAGHGYHEFEALDAETRVMECLLMGLRLREGLPLERLAAQSPVWEDSIDRKALDNLVKAGYLEDAADRLQVTESGFQRLEGILGQLIR